MLNSAFKWGHACLRYKKIDKASSLNKKPATWKGFILRGKTKVYKSLFSWSAHYLNIKKKKKKNFLFSISNQISKNLHET